MYASPKLSDQEVLMAEDFETLRAALAAKIIASVTREQIPTVDPEDIKSAWSLETEREEIAAPYKVEGQCRVFPKTFWGQFSSQVRIWSLSVSEGLASRRSQLCR
jgi:hypothetical protein